MKKNLFKTAIILIGLVVSITITSYSVKFERKITPATLCPYHFCQLSGGFPFPYLFDAEGVSRMDVLSFGEDYFHISSFSLDVIFYFLILMVIHYLVKKIKSNFSPDMNSKEKI